MLGKTTFRGGILIPEKTNGKRQTCAAPVCIAKPPERVAVLLSQSVGAPAEPLVKAGDRVLMCQKIGEPAGIVGAPVHASVSGKVAGIQPRVNAQGMMVQAVVIDNDGLDERDPDIAPANPDEMDGPQLIRAIREAGIVGLGGAAFPTSVKLSPPPGMRIGTVILNGAECEPYLTCDHRTMLDDADAVVDGLMIARRILGARRAVIAIEDNKPDAISAIQSAAVGKDIEVRALCAKYPQGGEKQLIQAVAGKQVPSGGLPMDVGCIVINVTTSAAISRAVRTGVPLIERVVTVTGAISQPKNLRARIGESIGSLVAQCGGIDPDVDKVVLGGPMMGSAAVNLEVPVVKATSGILLIKRRRSERRTNCIRCARCQSVCPIRLQPMLIHGMSEHNRFEDARGYFAMDCIECGCCSYVCPAKLPLVQSIRVAKREIARMAGRK